MCFITISWQEENDALKKIEAFEQSNNPTWVEIDITTKCNLSCSYCYNKINKNYSTSNKTMTESEFNNIIRILQSQEIKQITFGGGEPLLHPSIIKFVQLTHNEGIICHLISNGYLLDKATAIRLKRAGLSQIQMNIDSLENAKHDYMRGKKGSLSQVLRAFNNALEARLTCVAQTVLTNENKSEIFDIFDFSRAMGIQRSRVWPQVPLNMVDEPIFIENLIDDIKNYAIRHQAASIISYGPILNSPGIQCNNAICPPSLGMTYCIGVDGYVYFCGARKDMPLLDIESLKYLNSVDMKKVLKNEAEKMPANSYCSKVKENKIMIRENNFSVTHSQSA